MYNYSEKDKQYFTSLVDFKSDDECWEWKGYIQSNGYARVWFGEKRISVHRFSYFILYNIEDPVDGLVIDHLCYNRKCVNPKHLRQVTVKENIHAISQQGANARQQNGRKYALLNNIGTCKGEEVGNSKLSEEEVRYIYSLKHSGLSQQYVAEQFGVSRRNIGFIWNNKTWKHLHLDANEYAFGWNSGCWGGQERNSSASTNQ